MLKAVPAATLCLAILSGCKTEVALNLFTSDLVMTATKGTALDASAIVSLEASSNEKCTEVKDDMAQALAVGFSKVEFVECRRADLGTWADFRVTIPIRQVQTEHDSALLIWAAMDLSGVVVVLRQNKDTVQAITDAMPDNIRSLVSGQIDAHISLTVQNDLPEAVTVSSESVFLDGEPYQRPHDVTLNKRGEATIRLSDVGNAAIHYGSSYMFTIKKP